jgi:hypothetical protein
MAVPLEVLEKFFANFRTSHDQLKFSMRAQTVTEPRAVASGIKRQLARGIVLDLLGESNQTD